MDKTPFTSKSSCQHQENTGNNPLLLSEDVISGDSQDTLREPRADNNDNIRATLCLIGGFLALFTSFGIMNAMGLFLVYYEEMLLKTKSASTISWISTLQLFSIFVFGGPFGRIIDVYGAKIILIPCSILGTVSIALLSLCKEYYQIFLAQGIGFGIGASGLFTVAMVASGQWYDKNRALAMGLVAAGSGLGGILHPIYIRILMQRIGFPGAVRYTALVIGLCNLISCITISTKFPPKKWKHGGSLLNFALLKDIRFAVYTLGCFLVLWGLFTPWNYLPSMALRHGFSNEMSIYAISIQNAGSIIGRVVPAYAADRLGRLNLLIISGALCGVSILAFWLPLEIIESSTHLQILAFGALYGFASGAFISIMMPCVAEFATNMEVLGETFGLFQIFMGIASLTGLPIETALDGGGNSPFTGLIAFAGTSVFIGNLVIFGTKFIPLKE
ncbi:MFS transporter [Xylogone sp. PMI_703]|nr:MFS transporter [Xylogone sp. PMI_703]